MTKIAGRSIAQGALAILASFTILLTAQQKLFCDQPKEEGQEAKVSEFYDVNLARKHLTPGKRGGQDELFSDKLSDISIIQLIANPDRYHNKAVRISGFFHFEDEDSAVYLSSEAANYLNTQNGFWVSFNQKSWDRAKLKPSMFNRKHVAIAGIFHSKKSGHMGMFPGEISEVWLVLELTKFSND